jgi:hypothetical protein
VGVWTVSTVAPLLITGERDSDASIWTTRRRNCYTHPQVSVCLIQDRHFARKIVLITRPNPRFRGKNRDLAMTRKNFSIFPLTA